MEFKKIDETKFQCLLYEEDLEDNNISIDDFFRNDTSKIHGLLDVVMEKAHKSIGIIMDSGVMSLQLAPQPNHSILLTISSGKDDFGDMLRQAGERASQAISSIKPKNKKPGNSNVIKKDAPDNTEELVKAAPFSSVENEEDQQENSSVRSVETDSVSFNVVQSDIVIFQLESLNDFEEFCAHCSKTWGINNALYKADDNKVILVVEKGRCAKNKFRMFANELFEYGELISQKESRVAYIKEHYQVLMPANSVNIMKKVLSI